MNTKNESSSMMLNIFFIVLVICLVMLILSPHQKTSEKEKTLTMQQHDDENPSDGGADELKSGSEATEFLKGGSKRMILVHAPWCGHCTAMMPDYIAASKELADQGIIFVRLEASAAGQQFLKEHEVVGFPSMIVAGRTEKYSGGRTRDALVAFGKTL
jgi:thiol-disulfide isomerase/thioredoxin